jgi:hypothetical protein
MKNKAHMLVAVLACSAFALLNTGIFNDAHAANMDTKSETRTTADKMHGKVTEVIEAEGYTYAQIDTGKEKVWAAGPVTPIKVGDMIGFPTKMPMQNFHSQSMNRDFSIIYFVDNFVTGNEAVPDKTRQPIAAHGLSQKKPLAEPVKNITKVKGGTTIAEIHTNKTSLNGKTVQVRGKVTKLTTGVLGKNWLHIMDSSSHEDLTITTTSKVGMGDIVVAKGKIGLDKDFGYGYVYPVILEDAEITRE